MFFVGDNKINDTIIESYEIQRETFSEFKVSINLKENTHLTLNQIQNIINEIDIQDNFTLKVEIKCENDSIDSYSLNSKTISDNDTLSLNSLFDEVEDEEFIQITLTISKESYPLNIYCYDFFLNTLKSFKLSQLLSYLAREFKTKEKKIFKIANSSLMFDCRLFGISNNPTSLASHNPMASFERNEIIKNRNQYSNQNNMYEYDFLPSDFLNTCTNSNTELDTYFNKLRYFLSVSFISNISKIDNNNNDLFEISILQQRSLILNTNFSDLVVDNASALYDIYKWIYEEKFTSEKLYHARAIISKDLIEEHNTWVLPENSLASCQTTHSIYLKENVEKYLETKGRVAELIAEITVKNRESIVYITNSFKNNNATLLTYFISLFIFNSLSSNNFEIFNKSNYVLTLLFLGISSGILYMTYRQVNIDIAASETHFESVKNIYADIFDSTELDSIFKSNYYNDSVKSVKKSFSDHKWFWICEIIIIFLVITVVTFFLEDLIDMWNNIVFLLK